MTNYVSAAADVSQPLPDIAFDIRPFNRLLQAQHGEKSQWRVDDNN
jgi:hypothetical protein